jgi:predicted MPP superfamily phosphohydrolase
MSDQDNKHELTQATPFGQLAENNLRFLEDSWHNEKIYYITDIHLEHHVPEKEMRKFRRNPKPFITKYIRNLLEIPEEQEEISKKYDYLLVGGDVACSYQLVRAFYEVLCEYWFHAKIIAILGNHELWDCPGETIGKKFESYKRLFKSLGIKFLQNAIYVFSRYMGVHVIPETNIPRISDDEFREIGVRHPVIILGGLGFSGLNPLYNADHGFYRDVITSQKDDLKLTKRFLKIHKRLSAVIHDLPVIVFTHTPFSDWSNLSYNKNWIYVNGHNHRNSMIRDDGKTVYSDNQVGYDENNPRLKYFTISDLTDIFHYYSDGVYEITKEKYMEFNRYIGIHMEYFKRNGKIYMVKSSGRYMFFYEDDAIKTGRKYILNGGSLKSLHHQNLEYYLEHMPIYAQGIENILAPYYNALKRISIFVKQFGGYGKIHGSIVDIDFCCHIYLDPLDCKAIPYFAIDIKNKWAYPSVELLLKENNQELYQNFKLLISKDNSPIVYDKSSDILSDLEPYFVAETGMYKMSNLVKALQYISKANVIRVWDEELLSRIMNKNQIEAIYK